MKRFILYLFSLAVLCSCGESIEGSIKDIYGNDYSINELSDNETNYILDYSGRRDIIDNDVNRLKDKIDKITNSLSNNPLEYSYKSDGNTGASTKDDCISTNYTWETPSIMVLMIVNRCVPDKGNQISIYVKNK